VIASRRIGVRHFGVISYGQDELSVRTSDFTRFESIRPHCDHSTSSGSSLTLAEH